MELRYNVKGRILEGQYSPKGEVLLEDDREGRTGGYYIYIWPNDGTKWTGTNKDMLYDVWFENEDMLRGYILEDMHWVLDWYHNERKNDTISTNCGKSEGYDKNK